MTRMMLPAQDTARSHALPPNRYLGKGAATSFIVHGHRHACLYRGTINPLNPFIVLKICKNLWLRRAAAFAYLENNEAQGRPHHA